MGVRKPPDVLGLWVMSEQFHTVGILEDDPHFGAVLVALVTAAPDLRLAFACETVAEALSAFRQSAPDLVLVDMQLPDGSGLELIRAAHARGTASLMLTVLADRTSVLGAFEEGAHGYLLKDTEPSRISEAIADALAGQNPISPEVARHLLQIIRKATPGQTAAEALTEREQTVLGMIARGLTYAEVADAAAISVHTVGDHIKAIYRKLGVNSKSEAVHEARALGWLRRFD